MTESPLIEALSIHRLSVPARGTGDPMDLTGDRWLSAVRIIRTYRSSNEIQAALSQYAADRLFGMTTDEIRSRYDVPKGVFLPLSDAFRHAEFHDLRSGYVSLFGDSDIPDGTATIIVAAGATPEEIKSFIGQGADLDANALAVVAGLRGYRVPAPDAHGVWPRNVTPPPA